MPQQNDPKRKESHPSGSIRSSLEEKFAAYDKFIQSGYRVFSEGYNDDCIHDEYDDDYADCNYFNCC